MPLFRCSRLVVVATCLAIASPALAQTAPAPTPATPPAAASQPAATPATAKSDAAKPARREAADNAQKRACDKTWKTEKAKTKAVGWKPYFVYMASCM